MVVCGCNDASFVFNDSTNRHFVLIPRFNCLVVGERHVVIGVPIQRGRVFFFEKGGHLEDMKVVKWESGKGRNQKPNFLPFCFLGYA